jgi:hypothetical protein
MLHCYGFLDNEVFLKKPVDKKMFKHDFTIMIRYLTKTIFDNLDGITTIVENPLRDSH